jgi:chemotaxis protein MotA
LHGPPGMRDTSTKRRLQPASVLAVLAALSVLVVAQTLEGGTVGTLLHGPAAVIVVGGTMVATLISYSLHDVAQAMRSAARTFMTPDGSLAGLTNDLVHLSVRAHREGVLALEKELDRVGGDSFLGIGLELVIDSVPAPVTQGILRAEMRGHDAHDDLSVRVFESAAGYAPTFGILGAVLGLMQVMHNLATPARVGEGIGVAFVATVYGLGLANLLLLPVAGRLRERALIAARRRDVIAEAVAAIQQGVSPRLVAQALSGVAPGLPRVDAIAVHQAQVAARLTKVPA